MSKLTPDEADRSPQEMAACQFMAHKGYPGAQPYSVDAVEGRDCWYYTFKLPEGVLELEVEWDQAQGWHVCVMDFVDCP